MKCPNCSKTLIVPSKVWTNVKRYGTSNTITGCCGTVVKIISVAEFHVSKTTLTEDDWGRRVKKNVNAYMGTVIPSNLRKGAWTYTYILPDDGGTEVVAESVRNRTYPTASEAKRAMRLFCGVN